MKGFLNVTSTAKMESHLPSLNHKAKIVTKCHVKDNLLNYIVILDGDILHDLGIIFNCKNKTIT